MRKILDSSLIRSLGWKPKIQIKKGLSDTINWYKTKKSQSSIVSFSK